jgi:hypothetical protein
MDLRVVKQYQLKKNKQRRIDEAVNRLLTLPETPVPEDWAEWETEYLKNKYSSGNPAGRGLSIGST